MKKLISANPVLWNVSMSYLKLISDDSCLKVLRRVPVPVKDLRKMRPSLHVNHNGCQSIFLLGKNGEYFSKNGQSLTKLMEDSAKLEGNKISIS